MLTEEQIYTKIEEIYNSEKGKGFITHLIRSFFPIGRTNYLFSKNDKKSMFCALTRTPLVSKEDVLKIQLENAEELFKDFAERIKGNDTGNVIRKIFKGKMLALECENSTKLLSTTAYRQLYNFVTTQMLNGNKHINFVVSDEIKKENKTKDKTDSKVATANQPQKQQEKKVIHKSTTKLGDMDALVKLKEQLKKEGK